MTTSESTSAPSGSGDAPPTELKRAITPKLLLLFIIGDVLGTGVYALMGKVAGQAGGALWLPFLIAFLAAFLTAFSYLELVGKYPKAAGAALYTHKAFGIHFLTFIVTFAVLSSGMSSAASAARSVGAEFFPGLFHLDSVLPGLYADGKPTAALVIPIAIAFLMIFAAVNWRGVSESVKANVVFTFIELGGLLMVAVVAIIAIFGGEGDASRLVDFGASTDTSVFVSVIGATSLAFFAMVGFEDSVNMAEETTTPSAFPKAMVTGLGIAALIYLTLSVLASVLRTPEELSASEAGALKDIVTSSVEGFPVEIFLAISIFAVANSALINMMMASRLLYGMSKEHIVPKVLGKVDKRRRTPWTAIVFTSLIAMALTAYSDTATLGATTSLLLLCVFTIVNIAVLVLRKKPVEHKHFKTPTILPILGVIVSVLLIIPWNWIMLGNTDPSTLDDSTLGAIAMEQDKFVVAGWMIGLGVVLWILTYAVTQFGSKKDAPTEADASVDA